MPTRPLSYDYSFITRTHLLFASLITAASACLYLIPDFPFPVGFLGVCIASAVLHLALFLMFSRLTPFAFTAVNVINLFMLSLAVHYTGGILSPYTMVFALVLISATGYGMKMPVALGASIGSYGGVVIAEKMGALPPSQLTALEIYKSWPATLVVLFSVVGFMAISGSIYKATVTRLRAKIGKELGIKQTLSDRLARLDAPSQVGLLVNKIAHDITGPLGAVKGLLELVKDSPRFPNDAKLDLQVAVRELTRVNALVNRMLEYIKPGGLQREQLDLDGLVNTVLSVVSFLPDATDIRLARDMGADGELRIEANKLELQQVFFNILKNAVDALPPSARGKTIRVRTARRDDFAVITISDNGPGFPLHTLPLLGREMISTKAQGSGIGLLIANEIIEAYGGRLEFKNQKGGGASVTASIPLYQVQVKKEEKHEKVSR